MACLTAGREDYRGDNDEKSRTNHNEIPNPHSIYRDILCGCGVEPASHASMKRAGKSEMNSCEWSRLGPMGYLLEPKLYPVSICSTPVAPGDNSIESKDWQRNISEKCDLPLNVESISPLPSPDILRRINEDRLRSTYQTDFGHMDDYPWADYNDLMLTVGNKPDRQLEQPREEIKCRERARPPYLNGHEIPGRPTKDSSMFAFGTRRSKTKRRSGPQVTNLPPVRPKRASLQSRDTNDDGDDDGISRGVRNDHRTDRRPVLRSVTGDERSHVFRNATGDETSRRLSSRTGDKRRQITKDKTADGRQQTSGRVSSDNAGSIDSENIRNYRTKVTENAASDNEMKEFSYTAGDNSRQTSGDTNSIVRDSIDNRRMSNGRQDSMDTPSLNVKRNSFIKRDDKEVGRIQRDSRISRKNIPNVGKVKESIDELELLPSMPWTSEYQDIISRTADDILRTKLHYYGKIRLVTPHPDCL